MFGATKINGVNILTIGRGSEDEKLRTGDQNILRHRPIQA